MKAWLIYRKEDANKNHGFIDWLITEAQLLGIELDLVMHHELVYGVRNGQLFVEWQGKTNPAFVIMRAIDPLLSEQLDLLGIRVFNQSRVATVANDKARTHQLLAKYSIPMIDTQFVSKEELLASSFASPVVVKAVSGRGGNQVYLIESVADLLPLVHERYIVQKKATPGKDLRVFVMGDQIIGSVLRESTTDFRANYTLGGKASLYQLSAEQHELVQKIITIFPVDFAGIDFVFDEKDNLLFNEIEDIVGSRTLTSLTDINIAKLYIEYILHNMKSVQ
ncbi:ATP-grasp domain-containing protein [Gracilibacillus sp. S3-1-1]|uniref:ATP-grasp domain-containing protein n=1 Tax=Gracilibacillus pellucidus TaxID=3095368 RepID=A0ACC6M7B6_9BACI|nr:ATP-grasp domain-containing protein [Gracilibacillus sp. S3-1-1]MDX8046869.1 ATP-grasp domain-containing protein [Gracilibacillus sp. S3-1-1]